MFASPKIIASPISGQPVRPQMKVYVRNGKEVTEAHYIDPASGTFIRKALISVRDIDNPYQKNG